MKSPTVNFKGSHYPQEIMITCVEWYLTSNSSMRQIARKCAERGLKVHHCTIRLWVNLLASVILTAPPKADPEHFALITQKRKMRRQMRYLHRLASQDHTTIDFYVTDVEDATHAIAFFMRENPDFAARPEVAKQWLLSKYND